MVTHTEAETRVMSPQDFRSLVRKGEWTDITMEVCQNFSQTNLAILPKEHAFEFLLFCNRNPLPCPVLEVTELGDPQIKRMAPGADLRTDLPKYRVYQNGELIDEPTDVTKYWRDDLVGFVIGCSRTFVWAFRAANIPFRRYGGFRSTIPCVPAGRFHGPMSVSVRAFYNSHDAVRAVQISSRHLLNHGAPVHIGDPAAIGIKDLYHPDNPAQAEPIAPQEDDETAIFWACGITPQAVAVEAKLPFMITHSPGHMFVTDQLAEEMAIL